MRTIYSSIPCRRHIPYLRRISACASAAIKVRNVANGAGALYTIDLVLRNIYKTRTVVLPVARDAAPEGHTAALGVVVFSNSGLWIAVELLIVAHSFTGNSVSFRPIGSLA